VSCEKAGQNFGLDDFIEDDEDEAVDGYKVPV
jgi:hypothetical protein